jgi:hypothetical protein
MIILGFDPGGENGFGCCVLHANRFQTRTVSSIDKAMRWADAECGDEIPAQLGLTHFSTGATASRVGDELIVS